MTSDQQQLHFERLVDKMRKTLLSKGSDYSNLDKLSNFKSSGYITGTSAAHSCLNLIAIKVSRISNLLQKGGKPNNESLRDSSLDLAVYSILLDSILEYMHEDQTIQTGGTILIQPETKP